MVFYKFLSSKVCGNQSNAYLVDLWVQEVHLCPVIQLHQQDLVLLLHQVRLEYLVVQMGLANLDSLVVQALQLFQPLHGVLIYITQKCYEMLTVIIVNIQ